MFKPIMTLKIKNKLFGLISLAVAMAFLCSAVFIGGMMVVADQIEVWDGTISAPIDKGNGRYDIENAAQLAYIVKNGGGEGNVYTLTKDIYLNDITKSNWTEKSPRQWFLESDLSCDFDGILDGAGHIVHGIYYTGKESDYTSDGVNGAALIPWVGKVSVTNLGVENSYIERYSNHCVAAILGRALDCYDVYVTNCYVGDTVTIKGYNAASLVGGGVPRSGRYLRVVDCYNLAIIENVTDKIGGGLVGATWCGNRVSVKNCYSLGKPFGSEWQPPESDNVYATQSPKAGVANKVLEEDLIGTKAKKTLMDFDFTNTWEITNSYPTLRVFNDDFDYTYSISKISGKYTLLGDAGIESNNIIFNSVGSGFEFEFYGYGDIVLKGISSVSSETNPSTVRVIGVTDDGSPQIHVINTTGEFNITIAENLGFGLHKIKVNTVTSDVAGKVGITAIVGRVTLIDAPDDGVVGRVWSGKIATKYAGGSGTEADPYIINTPEQLAKLVSEENSTYDSYYKLTADIKLNDTSYEGWEEDARQWFYRSGFITYVFKGHFDGNGHIVSGIYYNCTDGGPTALFPSLDGNSTIKRLGVIESTIINKSILGTETYGAAITAQMNMWDKGTREVAVISECFSDSSVYVEAMFTGGVACGAGQPVIVENCFSTAELEYTSYSGGLVGNSWERGVVIRNSYSATVDRERIGSGQGFNGGWCTCENVYVDGPTGGTLGVIALNLINMQGDKPLTKMPGLDYENIWQLVEGGTPVLRCFENSEKYSSKKEAPKTEISFASMGGSKCESIFGYADIDKIDYPNLPKPTRKGYEFVKWHYFSDLTLEFDLEYFPNFNMVLYAEWKELGFEVDFEKKIDTTYDINPYCELFTPGIDGYHPNYIHGGLKSMHLFADNKNSGTFLLDYKKTFEVGKEYELTFWTVTRDDGKSGDITFMYANHPQVDSDIVGIEIISKISNSKGGKWTQHKLTFVASSPYVLVSGPVGVEMWFDDFQVVPTGKTGAVLNQNLTNPNENLNNDINMPDIENTPDTENEPDTDSNIGNENLNTNDSDKDKTNNKTNVKVEEDSLLGLIVLIACEAAVLLGGIIAVAIIIKKRKKMVA